MSMYFVFSQYFPAGLDVFISELRANGKKPRNLQILGTLGRGKFAQVYKATFNEVPCALKVKNILIFQHTFTSVFKYLKQ